MPPSPAASRGRGNAVGLFDGRAPARWRDQRRHPARQKQTRPHCAGQPLRLGKAGPEIRRPRARRAAEDRFEVDAKLAPHPVTPGLIRVDPKDGKKSKTRFAVLEKFAGWTLLQCEPLIGRSHQIRVHLRHAGLPIVGDGLYGGKPLWLSHLKPNYRLKPGHEERPLFSRAALHAEELASRIPSPATPSPSPPRGRRI